MRVTALCLLLSMFDPILSAGREPAKPEYEPTSSYTARDVRGWTIYVNHRVLDYNSPLVDPAAFCPRYMWEYRDTPGDAYWPQLFAEDHRRYDSIVLFDDFYAPVVYLNPQPNRAYEHPAGGYHALIVCWTDQ